MKYLNISILALVFGALLFSSCSKDSTITENPENLPERQFMVNSSLINFEIPIDLAAPVGSVIAGEEIIEEEVLRNGEVFQVRIEYAVNSDDQIISIAVSEDFAESAGYNSESFILENYDTFIGFRNGVYKAQRGWLGRFFVGSVVNMGPCIGGARAWVNDPWWGNPYGGGESPC